MDLDDELNASDPARALTSATHAAVMALVAEAEATTRTRPRGRRLAVLGGVAGTVLVGAGVANAAGVPVLGISSSSHPRPSCSVSVLTPLTGVRQISMTRDSHGLIELKSLMAKQDGLLANGQGLRAPAALSSPSPGLPDVVQRLDAAQKRLAVVKAKSGAACPPK